MDKVYGVFRIEYKKDGSNNFFTKDHRMMEQALNMEYAYTGYTTINKKVAQEYCKELRKENKEINEPKYFDAVYYYVHEVNPNTRKILVGKRQAKKIKEYFDLRTFDTEEFGNYYNLN